MAYVKIPKDLTKVKTKVALNMTKRQLIGFSVSVLIGFPLYLFCKNYLNTDISMIIMSIAVFPILFATIYEKDNLPFEKHLAYILKFHKSKKIRLYKARSIYHTERAKKQDIGNKNKASGRRKKVEQRQKKKTGTTN
ncbi:PrgI family protein [Fusobacterium necrophorum]|uniref:PrgI family protein n=1 Tax=Fusobacterium necrophorum TaxID=859 RepID=UPI00254F529A|nr:PrgI family protein [Fusobacterium necrophorum]MDK4501224.1 PrgI family protein [Fusobacterium necrophorum]